MRKKAIVIFSIFINILFLTTILIPSTARIEYSNDILEINNIDRESWWWSEVELVSEESTLPSDDLRTVIDEDDIIHMVWRDETDLAGSGGDEDIFYRKFNITSNSWSAIEVVSTESASQSWDPALALDSQGNIHVVWEDDENYLGSGFDHDILYKQKDSSTGVWSSAEIISTSSDLASYGAEIDIDSENNVHVVWEDNHDFDGTDRDIIYKVRDATTETWSTHTVISTDSTMTSYSPVILVDHNDHVYISWYDYTAGLYGSGPLADVLYKKWDPVNDWSSGSVISYESLADDSYSPYLTVDDTNSIHVAWYDTTDLKGSGTDGDIFYRKLDSASSTWSDFIVISTESDALSNAVHVVVDSDFNVHFTWQENANIGGAGIDTDIFYRSLDAETSSLSDLVLISELSYTHTYNPSTTIDSNEFIHVMYYDYSNLLSSGTDQDIFYKKHVGPPGTPVLHPISPATTSDKDIALTWSEEISANSYKVYRSSSYITDTSALTALDNTSDSFYFDSLSDSGVFYYAVVASNEYGVSEISNIEAVEYQGGFGKLFANLNWGEILIIGGFLGVLQIITAVVIIITTSNRSSAPAKKGKKK